MQGRLHWYPQCVPVQHSNRKKGEDIFLFHYLKNQKGIAAIMGVIAVIIILGTIAMSFFAETQQEHAGSALTYTSANAFMITESGIRYTESCMQTNDITNCNFLTATHTSDWSTLTAETFDRDFGGGNFSITFQGVTTGTTDADNVRVNSVGTFRGAIREIGKNVTRAVGTVTCNLSTDGVSSCTTFSPHGGATTPPETEDGFCPSTPLVDAVSLDGTPCVGGIPTAEYPNYDPGTHLTGSNLNYFKFCSMTISETVNAADGDVIYVKNDLTIENSDLLITNGTVSINVGGDVLLKNSSEIQVNGDFTLHTDGNLTLNNGAKFNETLGDPAKALALVGSDATLNATNADFYGGLIANGTVTIKNSSTLSGAVIANSVIMNNKSTVVFDDDAGIDTSGYLECTEGLGTASPPDWGEG